MVWFSVQRLFYLQTGFKTILMRQMRLFGLTLSALAVFVSACVPTSLSATATVPAATVTVVDTTIPESAIVELTQTRTPWPENAPGLRDLAEQRQFFIGAAVQSSLLADEEAYRETVRKEFNLITAEYEMKMCEIWPERDRWDFAAGDAIVAFAQENRMRVRGHTLVWIECVPEWLVQGKFNKDEAAAILQEYITTVVGRYRGKITYWDVLNETIERKPIWAESIGPEYIALAFQWAHEADPAALLFYNDYNAEAMTYKSERQYQLMEDLLEQGVPVHGVGLQAHFKGVLPADQVAANIARLNELGLEVHITEIDVPQINRASDPDGHQASIYADILAACLGAKNCPVFVIWGFTDKYTWVKQPNAFPLIFDREYQPKPAYEAIFNVLQGRP
jgi:endo-1,4-beta-xylanase